MVARVRSEVSLHSRLKHPSILEVSFEDLLSTKYLFWGF